MFCIDIICFESYISIYINAYIIYVCACVCECVDVLAMNPKLVVNLMMEIKYKKINNLYGLKC